MYAMVLVIVRAANHANALVARGIDGKDQTQRGPWSLITIQGRVYSRVFPAQLLRPRNHQPLSPLHG